MKQATIPTLAICTPVRYVTTPEYDHALRHHSPNATVLQVKGAPIDHARNLLVKQILQMRPRPEHVVWLDSDAFWLPGTIERLTADLGRMPASSMVVPW